MRAVSRALLLSLAFPSAATGSAFPSILDLPSVIGGSHVADNDPVARSTVGLHSGEGVCTASIIAPDIIVTAAHCLQNKGRLSVSFGSTLESDTRVRARASRRHPDFGRRRGRDEADIAVVLLGAPLPRGFVPVPVFQAGSLRRGQAVLLAGYGVSDGRLDTGSGRLRKTETQVLRTAGTEVLVDQSRGRGVCRGDSGGPGFVRDRQGRLQVWGVVSRGPQHCDEEGVFTRIDSHDQWIRRAIADMRAGGEERGDERREEYPEEGEDYPPEEDEEDSWR